MAYDPPSPPSGPIDPSRIGRLTTPLSGEALERRRRLAAFDDALADYDRSFPGAGDPPPPPPPPGGRSMRSPST